MVGGGGPRPGAAGDPSEATAEIARLMTATADAWPESAALDTDRPVPDVVADAVALSG